MTLKLKAQLQRISKSNHQERFIHLAQHMSPQGEESEIVALYLFKNEDYYYLLLIGVDAVMEPNQHKCEDRTF